jgi:16S rRNA (cytosine1402-N4)-methyltransferase
MPFPTAPIADAKRETGRGLLGEDLWGEIQHPHTPTKPWLAPKTEPGRKAGRFHAPWPFFPIGRERDAHSNKRKRLMDADSKGEGWPHEPVMVGPVLDLLDPHPGGIWVDATIGAGGHAEKIAERIGSEGRLIGLDVDPQAIEIARSRGKRWPCRSEILQAGYQDLDAVLKEMGIAKVRGILVDLGVSSLQIDRPERGFSFRSEGPLDMRMDPDRSSATHWLAGASQGEIHRALARYGEEKRAAQVARAIVRERERGPIETTERLAEIVLSCFPDRKRAGRVHPATRTFQAIRIAVNDELGRLETLLSFLPRVLEEGGRTVFLAYHSLEDRLVKRAIQEWEGRDDAVLNRVPLTGRRRGPMESLTRKAIRPTSEEIGNNPRSRSARLRAARRTELPFEG